MHRPYETAQIILQNSKDLKIEKIDSLVEISHGLWEGKLEEEIREKWPALLKNWHDKPEEVIMPEGESINCLLYTSPSPRDATLSRMPSSA